MAGLGSNPLQRTTLPCCIRIAWGLEKENHTSSIFGNQAMQALVHMHTLMNVCAHTQLSLEATVYLKERL